MWERWRQGDTLREIARFLERPPASVFKQLSRTGGIQPAPRTRSARELSLNDRETISRGLAAGKSLRAIALELNRAPSTISREVDRNGGCVNYRAATAEHATWERALRPKVCKLAGRAKLVNAIATKLIQQWSPQQIAGWLKRRYPNNELYHVSHETIYKTLYIQTRGALKKELLSCLRTQRVMRRSGTNNSYIATLVERHSRLVMLAKVKDKTTNVVMHALIKQAKKLPAELYKSLTLDRGSEFAAHQTFTIATGIDIYFCDPQSPWQRGSNENTNRLLRQYFPKGTDLSVHSQTELNRVARQLNERPRKTLDYETPAERFEACRVATA